ncbi:NAD(P)H-hydrate dehydratase [Candidatus Marinamargulisbacteria bacterium SCGC AG-343-D04]|nr:NAD(P)H-hydrate dehydratase [Candidatus Marinamargulisbacteria bacterium SCGC AG-343-D04]
MSVLESCKFLLHRDLKSHKGQCGRVGVIAGSPQYFGAAQLTSFSGLKMGAGLVFLYSALGASSIVKTHPEIIVHECLSDVGKESFNSLKDLVLDHRCDVVAMGPGLGRSEAVRFIVNGLLPFLNEQDKSIVCDADALMSMDSSLFQSMSSGSMVLTPHVGEFKHLFPQFLDLLDDTDSKRLECAKKAAIFSGQVIVLKGHHSVVTDGDRVYVNSTGNASMATAGSGDVLTGMIAACIGQGLSLFDAASVAVYIHGLAGDCANEELSISLVASDIYDYIPKALEKIKKTMS